MRIPKVTIWTSMPRVLKIFQGRDSPIASDLQGLWPAVSYQDLIYFL